MASMYAVYHGPVGLRRIAERTHRLAASFAAGLTAAGLKLIHASFFDTVTVDTADAGAIVSRALAAGMNLRHFSGNIVSVSFDETSTREDVLKLLKAFAPTAAAFNIDKSEATAIPSGLARTSKYLTHPTFNSYHSETEMLRYMTASAIERLVTRALDDSSRLLHDEIKRHCRDDSRDVAGVRFASPVRPDGSSEGFTRSHPRARRFLE